MWDMLLQDLSKKKKMHEMHAKNGKEDFTQDYCKRLAIGEIQLNSTERKEEEF